MVGGAGLRVGFRLGLALVILIAVGSVAVGEVPAEKPSALTVTVTEPEHLYGQTIEVQAQVTASGLTPIGYADVYLNDVVVASSQLRDGTAHLLVPGGLAVGPQMLTVGYRGQGNVLPSRGQVEVHIRRAQPTVQVIAGAEPIIAPERGEVTVQVNGGPHAATGQLTVFVDGRQPQTATLDNGRAVLTLPVLHAGLHQITAHYGGDERYLSAQAKPVPVRVQVPSRTVLVPEPATATFGQQISVTARHTAAEGEITGTSRFALNGRDIGQAQLVAGAAVLPLPADLPVGTHRLTASYPGNSTIVGSSASATLVVQQATAELAAALAAPVVLTDQRTTVDVTATGTATPPQGRVYLIVDGAQVGAADLRAGAAQLTVPTLALGAHTVVVRYTGDTNYLPTETAPQQLTAQMAPTVDFGLSAAAIGPWDVASVTVTVSGGAQVPEGTVRVLVDGTDRASGTLSGGRVVLDLPELRSGAHQITVAYDGLGTYAAATSPGATLTVAEAPWINGCHPAARACIDLTNNTSWIQERGQIIYGPVPTTSGMPGHRTPEGMFKVHWKHKDHKSSLFNNAPMPYSIFFVGGIAFHVGSLRDPSHGCIHLSRAAAIEYWRLISVGDPVYAFGYARY